MALKTVTTLGARGAFIALALSVTLLASTCGPNDRAPSLEFHALTLSGQHRFTKNGAVPPRQVSIRYQVLLEGEGFFRGSPTCDLLPNHMAAIASYEAQPDASGGFVVRARVTDFRARTNKECSIRRLSRENLKSIRVQAQLPAQGPSCQSWCDEDTSCITSCETDSRVFLAGTRTDEIQTRELVSNASDQAIRWSIDLPFESLGAGITSGDGPDLQMDRDGASRTLQISEETFVPDRCGVESSCVRAFGKRTLLRFDGTIINRGNRDFVLDANDPLLEFDECHGHEHLSEILAYELFSTSGNPVFVEGGTAVGRKQSFCMMDTYPVNDVITSGTSAGKFTCENQGISAGWADLYESSLECQFLDITGVPDGEYRLRISVNPDSIYDELDYANNVEEIPLEISGKSVKPLAP